MFKTTGSVSAAVLLTRVSQSVSLGHSSGKIIPDTLFAYNRWGDWWPFPITAQSEAKNNPNKLSVGVRDFQKRGSVKAYVLVVNGKFPEDGRSGKRRGKRLIDGVMAVCWAPGSCGPFTKAGRIWRYVEEDGSRQLQEVRSFVAKRGRKDEIKIWLDESIAGKKS